MPRFPLCLRVFAAILCAAAAVPDIDSLQGTWQDLNTPVRHGYGLPTANSEIGSVIADENVFALRSATFAPITQGPYSPILRNQSHLGRLTIDDAPIPSAQYQWLPYGFRRRSAPTTTSTPTATDDGTPHDAASSFLVETEVRIDFSQPIMLARAVVSAGAPGASGRLAVELSPMFRHYGAATCTPEQWEFPNDIQTNPPCWNWYAPRPLGFEAAAFVVVYADAARHVVVVQDALSPAIAVVGLTQSTTAPDDFGLLGGGAKATWKLGGSSSQTSNGSNNGNVTIEYFVLTGLASDQVRLLALAANISSSFSSWMDAAWAARQAQLAAALTPNNTRYSGHLPLLTAADPDISRMYYMSLLAVLSLERVLEAPLPISACAGVRRVWITGAAENCSTNLFFWDNAFLPSVLALLDPAAVRCIAATALQPDIGGDDARAGWGVDWRARHAVGAWYAANDMALFKLVSYYVTVTGDFAFLNYFVGNATVLQRIDTLGNHWRDLAQGARLADYGGAHNLLECVPSYIHRVAAFNAANVWMMRMLAGLYAARGNTTHAAALRADATALAAAVQTLYVPGAGYWRAQYPNGTAVAVRHVVDLVYVSEFMGEDVGPGQWREMEAFATTELLSGDWMRAQSLLDLYANFSDRTDHGPWGAYDGWPALLAAACARQGSLPLAEALLQRFAAVARRGPYGQAHGIWADPAQPAYKPFDFTLFNEMAGGAFAEVLLLFVFGLQPDRASLASPQPPPLFAPTTPRSLTGTLTHVRWQGRLYTATAGPDGVLWTRE
eukprot:m.75816 g.75816  ORF g.75816 m.75816 type:complete len:782 (-) comp13146_c0_seq1:57-2402(-)